MTRLNAIVNRMKDRIEESNRKGLFFVQVDRKWLNDVVTEIESLPVYWDVIDDILNTLYIAEESGAGDVYTTVQDYCINRYGDIDG